MTIESRQFYFVVPVNLSLEVSLKTSKRFTGTGQIATLEPSPPSSNKMCSDATTKGHSGSVEKTVPSGQSDVSRLVGTLRQLMDLPQELFAAVLRATHYHRNRVAEYWYATISLSTAADLATKGNVSLQRNAWKWCIGYYNFLKASSNP